MMARDGHEPHYFQDFANLPNFLKNICISTPISQLYIRLISFSMHFLLFLKIVISGMSGLEGDRTGLVEKTSVTSFKVLSGSPSLWGKIGRRAL